MIEPTSASSRFNAGPVTPFPKSSISLSFARVSPSILATPSPISRTVPTFCFVVVVLTAAISVSICSSNVAIDFSPLVDGHSKSLLKRGEPRPYAAVIDIAAYLDTHSTDQGRILREGSLQPRAVHARQTSFNGSLQLGRQSFSTFHFGHMSRGIQFHQPPEMREYAQEAARPGRHDLLQHLPGAFLVEQAIDKASPE